MLSVLLTLGLAIAASRGARAESREARAERLFEEARGVLRGDQCTPDRGCPAFAAAAAKLRRAFELHPKLDYASYYCRAHANAWEVEQLGARREVEALAMCDATWFFHEDAGRRDQARAHAAEIRDARRTGHRRSDVVAAAGALFGVGLVVKQDADGAVTLAYGDVTADDLQAFIRDYYYPVATAKQLGTGILRSARGKLDLCKGVAELADDANQTRAVEELCELQAAREANGHLQTFVGDEPVDLGRGRGMYTLNAKLRYEPMLSVVGPTPADDYDGITDQRSLLSPIVRQGKRHRFYQDAVDLLARIDRVEKQRKREADKRERKLGKGRNKVVFFSRPAHGWDVPDTVSGEAASCSGLAARAYAGKGIVEAELVIDGEVCYSDLGQGKLDLVPGYRESCKPRLDATGEHTVAVSVYATRWKKTGTKRVDVHRDSVDVRDVESYTRGKRVARGSIRCGR